METNNIIEQYYRGIVQQLQAEVSSINNLFGHQGVKGEGNESVLRDLLTRFIPKKYSVGTGIVIDRTGKQSRQCDIVIYDTHQYPSLLSLSSTHLFPVDIVYATIEVKTTLDTDESQKALTNVASVKALSMVNEQFQELVLTNGVVQATTYTPQPPLGFVFAYNSNTRNFATFKKWFTPKEDDQASSYPTMVGCLDQGIIRFTKLYPEAGNKPEGWAIPLYTDSRIGVPDSVSLETPIVINSKSIAEQDRKLYHFTTLALPNGNATIAIDQSRVLLHFILLLSDLLAKRKLNPHLSFFNHYLSFLTSSRIVQ